MFFGNRKQKRHSNRRKQSHRRNETTGRSLLLESLEDRRLMAVAGGFEAQLVRFPVMRSLQARFATDQVHIGRYLSNRLELRRPALNTPAQPIDNNAIETQPPQESAAANEAAGTTDSKDIKKVEKTPEAEKQIDRLSRISQGRGRNLISSLLRDRQHGRLQGENPLVNDRKDQLDGDDEENNPKIEEDKPADRDNQEQPQTLEQLRERRAELESQHQENEHQQSELNKAANEGAVDEDEMSRLSEERERLQDQLSEVDQKILEKLKKQYAERNDELNQRAQKILAEEFGECHRTILPHELRKLGETNPEFQALVQAVHELKELAKEIARLESQNPVNGMDAEGKKQEEQEEKEEQEEQKKPVLSFIERRAIARCLKIDVEDVDKLLRDGELDLDDPIVGQRRIGLGILDFFPRRDKPKERGTLQIFFPPTESTEEDQPANEDPHDDSEADDTDDQDNHQNDSQSNTKTSHDKEEQQNDKEEQQSDKKDKQSDKEEQPKDDHNHSSDQHSSERSTEPIPPFVPSFPLPVESHLTDKEYEDLQRAGENAKKASANHAAAIDRADAAQRDCDNCEKELEELRRQHDAAKEAVNAAEEALKKAEAAVANYQADVDAAKREARHADRQFWAYARYRSIAARRSGRSSGDYLEAQQQFDRGKRNHGETGRAFQRTKHSLADRQAAVEAAKAQLEAAQAAEQAARDALKSKEEECCNQQNKRQQADADQDQAAKAVTQSNDVAEETYNRIGGAVHKRMVADHTADIARRKEAEAEAEAKRRKEAVSEQRDTDNEPDVATEETRSDFDRKIDEILKKNGYDPDDPVIRDVVARIHLVGHGGAEALVDLGALVTVPLNGSLGVTKSIGSYITKFRFIDPFHDLFTTVFGLMVDFIFSHLDADTVGELVDHIFGQSDDVTDDAE